MSGYDVAIDVCAALFMATIVYIFIGLFVAACLDNGSVPSWLRRWYPCD